MKGQIGFIYLFLVLALCCLLIPREGESAGGILGLSIGRNEPLDETLDGPEREQGLVGDPSERRKGYVNEPLQTGELKMKSHLNIEFNLTQKRCNNIHIWRVPAAEDWTGGSDMGQTTDEESNILQTDFYDTDLFFMLC